MYFGSDWIALLIALFSVLLFIFGTLYLTDTVLWLLPLLAPELTNMTVLSAVYLFLFLLLSPLVPGVLSYAYDLYRTAHGELSGRVPATEIFHCYASPRMMLTAAADVAVQLAVISLPPAVLLAARYIIPHLPGYAAPHMLLMRHLSLMTLLPMLLWSLGAVLCFIGALFVCATLSPALFLSVARPELSLLTRLKYSFLYMRLHAGVAVFALFQFGLLTVLSLFFAGIPFFVYLLPYAIFMYISFSQEISNAISL